MTNDLALLLAGLLLVILAGALAWKRFNRHHAAEQDGWRTDVRRIELKAEIASLKEQRALAVKRKKSRKHIDEALKAAGAELLQIDLERWGNAA